MGRGACTGGSWPDSGTFNFTQLFGDLPRFGYPMRGTLFVGINDTIQAAIEMHNDTDKDYDLTGKHVEEWFAPRVYALNSGPQSLVFRDSSELGYRIRGWYGETYKFPTPQKIPAHCCSAWLLVMDIWNLPQGHFELCVVPTAHVPSDFMASPGSDHYEYYPAQTLADSLNALEACFWRVTGDSNFTAAKDIADQILALDSTSVTVSWLKAYNAADRGDSVTVRLALKHALESLNSGADPALPDSTKRPLGKSEFNYLSFTRTMLESDRDYWGQ